MIILVWVICEWLKVDIYKGIEIFLCYNKVRWLLFCVGRVVDSVLYCCSIALFLSNRTNTAFNVIKDPKRIAINWMLTSKVLTGTYECNWVITHWFSSSLNLYLSKVHVCIFFKFCKKNHWKLVIKIPILFLRYHIYLKKKVCYITMFILVDISYEIKNKCSSNLLTK